MGTSQAIRQAIASKPLGAVFSSADFLSVGTRSAVDQALSRMMRAGVIERVARGLYAAAGQSVATQTVANAVAQKTGEQVGLVICEGTARRLVVPTSGPSRSVKAIGFTVQFRRMSPRKVQLAASPKGQVLLGLWSRGKTKLTTLEILRATGDWAKEDIESYAALLPAWLRRGLEQAHSIRKSVKIGLSGAYDWSNSAIRDDVLIAKVLEKHRFEDVARLCFYYGVPKVKRVFKRHVFEPMTCASVTRMLGNISKGLRVSKERALTLHSRGQRDRPKAQIDYLRAAPKAVVSEGGFDVLGVDGLFVMKTLVVYDRVKSRDIYDLMVLTRDHGYTLDEALAAIDHYQPIRNKDPEHFKRAITGAIPLDKNDEGFSSIHLDVKMDEIYEHFISLLDDHEIRAVQQMRPSRS
jgi:hypothetical protein